MKTEPKHTPGPWEFSKGTMTIRSVVENYWLASMNSWDGAVDNLANAAFIVDACNNYERIKAERDELEGALISLVDKIAELTKAIRSLRHQKGMTK